MDQIDFEKIARSLRYHILRTTHKIGSGHPTSSFSAVELATVLFFKYFHFDFDNPENSANDRIIFSKGHASALLYSLYRVAGKLTDDEFLKYREFGSPLEGHPTNRFPFTEVATGSLGQGLSVGAGEAWALRMIYDSRFMNYESEGHKSNLINHKSMPIVYVLLGDGELAEGSIWEAADFASFRKLSNLIAICDINRLGQAGTTMYEWDIETFQKRFEAFGWETVCIDGHNLVEIDSAFGNVREERDKPLVILAKTIKGKGVESWEDKEDWHNKMLPDDELKKALEIYKLDEEIKVSVQKPEGTSSKKQEAISSQVTENPNYQTYPEGNLVATKQAFGNAIERLGRLYPNLVVLDGDVSNSLHTDQFKESYPDRFLQMYIAEQNMVGVAVGLAQRGLIPIVATFACFLNRAADQIRMIRLSGATVLFNGSYVGVSVGRDGPSQMGLNDVALFRSLPDSMLFYPADPYATEYLVNEMLKLKGVVYIRTTREPTPIIYSVKDQFPVGGSKLHASGLAKANNSKVITIVAAGITVHEALKAQKELEKKGMEIQVIDCYSVKPIDRDTLMSAAEISSAIVVVEDHFSEGGLGEAVMSVLANKFKASIYHLAVRKVPMSGSARELLNYEQIDAQSITNLISKVY